MAKKDTKFLDQGNIPQLSLDQRVAQMVMVGFRGLSIEEDETIAVDITERGIGGVVLFDVDVSEKSKRNIESPEQLQKLTTQLQSLSEIPLFIAVDQEGGQVARLKPEYGFPETVSHHWLGQRDCLSVTREQCSELARTLAANGFNLNFAPCVDLALNPKNPVIARKERSFSHDANIVTGHAIEFIKAHHELGLFCTLKHFPGHGSSKTDSHLGFVDVTDSWWPDELLPYEKLIELDFVDAIMTAHVVNGKLDEKIPATLSEKIISQKLRGEMAYDGLVITDDMQMKAISDEYGFDVAIEKAIRAGNDILLFGNNLVYEEGIAEKVIDGILSLLETEKISEARINESWERIWKLKSGLIASHVSSQP